MSETEDGNIKDINTYSLTEGLTASKYNKTIEIIFKNMPVLKEWHNAEILNYFNNVSWDQSIRKIHSEEIENLQNSDYLRRLIFDEIISNFLISSEIRKKIKKIKKKEKIFDPNICQKYLKKFKLP
mgnify:FL=1